MAKVVLDSSVLIALLDPKDAHHEATVRVTSAKNDYLISAITLSESLIAPYKFSQSFGDSIKKQIMKFFSGIVAVDEKIAAEAARIRAANKISLPDAIISATAEANKAQLWSCDNGLVKSHKGSKFISVDS